MERSPYSVDRNRRETSERGSVRGSDNDSRERRSRHDRESERRSRHSSPDEKYRKRKKTKEGSTDSRHYSDRDRRERKKDDKDLKNISSSSSSTKRGKTDCSPKDSNRNKDDSQKSLKPCDMPINISSEFEAESITDDSENDESPFTTLNVPKTVLLADFKEFVHPKEMIVSVENIPKGLFKSLKHILLPENLQRPIYF
uniref:Uncharacterized protein n=1 Tax=Panagrolaimus sp. PS1159 TaxID=55785 RepID=A0AC35GWI6_9BILA